MSDLLLAIVESLAEKCGNLFSMGASDGVTPRRGWRVWILLLLSIAAVVAAILVFGIWL